MFPSGTQQNVNCSTKPSAASSSSGFRLASRYFLSSWKGMSCRSAPDVLPPIPKTFSSRINLSRRMMELVKELQKSEEEVRKAVETEGIVITVKNTEISQTEAANIPQTSSFLTDFSVVVGRDQERDQLMNLLINEEFAIVGKVSVIAIVGSGGVGKTTLAGLVFNDPKVCSYFELRSWICVSTYFDIIRFTREMLEGACGNSYDKFTNLEVLQKKLMDKLESKRFLLVLDDMWEDKDQSQWDKMIALFNNCMMKRGIILVTTRNPCVAKMINARNNIYLHGLENDAFLSFFSTCIFNDPNFGGNWRLEKIGQEIANKLKGNPLAAKTVSALLKGKNDVRYWMKIKDSEEWNLQSSPNDIMPALRLSYEHMPFHLQRCFSYCAILPEDHPFTCEELVYLWMAQGFLDVRSERKRMEDIGSAYFGDLFNRGFFQTKQSTIPDLVYYTFHDLIHDLACMVASKECLTINGPELRQTPATIRHLSIVNCSERAKEAVVRALASLKGENLSTIINWEELSADTSENISELLKKTKFLRSMRLKLGSVVPHDYFIQNFVSLRYLSLNFGIFPGSNDIPSYTFPSEICRLYHLEVFEIEAAWNLDELPNNFSDLVSLRHFIVEGYLHSKILGVGKLISLQELNYFNVEENIGFAIEQLGPLEEIGGSLQISNLENVKSKKEASKAQMAEKKNLDALSLKWNYGQQENISVLEGLKPNTDLKFLEIRGYGGVASPTWLEPSLNFLESLTIEGCNAWDQLPPIGEWEFLKYLKLSGLATKEIGPQCYGTRQNIKFSSLEKLEIIDMPYLEKWIWSDQLRQPLCLKKLKELTIEGCHKLVDLPFLRCDTSEVLERFPFLENLKIEDCTLILQLPPLPYSSLLSYVSIARIKTTKSRLYVRQRQNLNLILDQSSSLKVGERLSFPEFSSLRELEISNISSLESLDLHSCVALENLLIKGCESLTSLAFGELLVCLKRLRIISCEALSSIKGLNRESLVSFPEFSSLRELEISNISSLESLDLHSCVALENLLIEGCESLTSLAFGEVLVCLKTLRIISCEALSSNKGLNLKSVVSFPEFSSLRELEISSISSLESLNLHSCVALENLLIKECESLTSLAFEERLVCLNSLRIISCKALSSIKGLKSWVNLKSLNIQECPGFIAAWDSASKEIEKTEPYFSLSVTEVLVTDAPLTLPICKQLASLESLLLEVYTTKAYKFSLELLTSIDLIDIKGCKKNIQSFPFGYFPSLKKLRIKFPHIYSSYIELKKELEKLKNPTNIKETHFSNYPVEIRFDVD